MSTRRVITYHITTTDEQGGQSRSTEHYGVFRKWQEAALRTNRMFVCQRTVEDKPNDQEPTGSQSLPA